jgi:uncharacterized protein (DUF1778 family)
MLERKKAVKTERVNLRFSPEEKARLETAAAAAGMTMTAYILFKLGEVAGEAIGTAIQKGGKK